MPKPKILLVDDVQLILELEKSFLKNLPASILTARNGQEALELIRQERPDLVYMDMNMPVMDGPTCCAAIKSDPDIGATPVIMVTTAGQQGDEAHCRRAGCDDFMTKPIDRREFLDKGRRLIAAMDRREHRVACNSPVSVTNGDAAVQGVSADPGVGVEFTEIDPDAASFIEAFVDGTILKL